MMQISILNRQRKYPVDAETVLQWATRILMLQNKKQGELCIVFVNNRLIRMYNRDYRKMDRATDVLSFPMLEGIGGDLHPDFLGDVMISLEKMQTDALLYQRDSSEHLLILLIHGILHLLGYDHERSQMEEKRMMRRERFILKRLQGP